ncbi:DMT family transporter [Spirulina subsalsa FACHB-351]|uniref:DMT family transporter n=1 Tax=Spirulina subsalsa FACHB-351 TaxID=234711 RepID=A0ABT3L1K7_9CYAN|nr:DMT family transporter [Spirulina subsalsa]MCW6035383.1 DMT family transporter [Spirulina subsalsa FACHB-351]
MPPRNPRILAYSYAIIGVSIMAGLGVFVKQINAPVSLIVLARFYLGFLFFLIYLLITRKIHLIQPFQKSFFPLILGGLSWAGLMFSYTQAILFTSLSYAVFLLYLAPFIATAIAFFWLKEKLTLSQTLALIIAFLGFIFILDFDPTQGLQNVIGSLWGLLSALAYASFVIINRKIPNHCLSQTRIFYQFLFTNLFLLPLWLQFKLQFLTLNNTFWLVGVGFFHGFLAITLMITAVRYLKASEYGIISYVEPLIAALLGFLLYSESLSLLQAMGGLLILGCGVSQVFLTKPS